MGALWDANAKRWYITEHHNPEDFKFWTICEDDEQKIEEEQETEAEENLTADDYIDDDCIGDDIVGDDVNITSRIEKYAASGGIAISGRVNASLERDPAF